MRVCLVTPYDLGADGGVNRHALGLAAALRERGDAAVVAGPCSGRPPDGAVALSRPVAVPANGSIARIGLFTSPRRVRALLAEGFDLVHVHEPLVPGPARLALSLSAAPVVATFHAFAEREAGLAWALRRLAARPLSRLARAIAVSEPAAAFARRVYGGRIDVVPNGLDAWRFAADRPSPARASRLLFVGRFGERRKGLATLLEAVARLRAQGRTVELAVAGDGPRARFAAAATRAGARFLGRLGEADLARLYASSDLFCAPSLGGESFGLVLAEAMAAGCPVVASDLAGYAEAAAGAALLVPAGSAAALAEAIARALDDATLRAGLAERGRRRAAELDWAVVAGRVRAVYAEALPAAKRAA